MKHLRLGSQSLTLDKMNELAKGKVAITIAAIDLAEGVRAGLIVADRDVDLAISQIEKALRKWDER